MKLFWTVLAVGLSVAGNAEARPEQAPTALVDAKNGLVTASLAVRQARLDWEKAEALVEAAEARLEAAQVDRERALEQQQGLEEATRSVASAEEKWRLALRDLDIQGDRLAHAESRLHAAEDTLDQAETAQARRSS